MNAISFLVTALILNAVQWANYFEKDSTAGLRLEKQIFS